MDETVGAAKSKGRSRRRSLVEMAAGKLDFLVGDGGVAEAVEKPEAAPDAVVHVAADPAAGAAVTAEAVADAAADTAVADEPVTESAAGTDVITAPGRDASVVPARPHQPARSEESPVQKRPDGKTTSRSIELDFIRLDDAGIMTPDSLRSRTTEEFRLIKRGVLTRRWQMATPNANLILVTSAVPGEGKTFCSMNLAMSIAFERDVRVLLIDADLSRPSIPKLLGIDVDRGLVDVLTDDSVDMADVLVRTNVDGLTLLPSGRQHHLSTELLASQRMAAFVEEIAQRYADRIVIFDSPPVLATSEPTALAQHVGQIVFVVRAERTSRQAVRTALEIFGQQSENVELVLNAARPQFGSSSFGYYYYKGYYYSSSSSS